MVEALGWSIGETCHAGVKISWAGKEIVPGMKGIILGPANQSAAPWTVVGVSADNRVQVVHQVVPAKTDPPIDAWLLVEFDNDNSLRLNVHKTQISRESAEHCQRQATIAKQQVHMPTITVAIVEFLRVLSRVAFNLTVPSLHHHWRLSQKRKLRKRGGGMVQ